MNDKQPPNDADIAQASAAWLASVGAGDAPELWVDHMETDWERSDDLASMWRFVLKLCEDVAPDDGETIGMIGAGPLWGMVNTWPDAAVTLIEAEVDANPTLLQALTIILPPTESIREQIDAILKRHGLGPLRGRAVEGE